MNLPPRPALLVLALLLGGCRPRDATGLKAPVDLPAEPAKVFVVVEENADYTEVTPKTMPYLAGLAAEYGTATEYYADTHPSIGNYFMLTSGRVVSRDDHFASAVDQDNLVREIVRAGKTWKSYVEAIPRAGFVKLNYDDGRYASRHNPLVYYTDVHDDSAQARHVVPFEQLAADLEHDSLPDFGFIVPDLCDDGHDCPLETADLWLRAHIDPLVQSPRFQENGLLLILYDEAEGDAAHGGGRVSWVVVSPRAKRGYRSAAFYQHESTLRLILEQLGIATLPGAAATAPDMGEFLNPPSAPTP
jgi:acid phosphatase